MTELLKNSINVAFDLYKGPVKRFYTFHISLLFLFLVMGTLATLVVSYPYVRMFDKDLLEQSVIWALLYNPIFYHVFNASLILLFAAYACMLPGLLSGETKPHVNEFFRTLNGDRLTIAFLWFIAAIILAIVSYQLRRDIGNPDADPMYVSTAGTRFENWSTNILSLIAQYSPYAGAYFVILNFVKTQHPGKKPMSRLKGFGTMLILSFCINVLWVEIAAYINKYIVKIPLIIFNNNIAEIIFMVAIYLVLTPFFMPVISAMLYYPVALNEIQELSQEEIAEGGIQHTDDILTETGE